MSAASSFLTTKPKRPAVCFLAAVALAAGGCAGPPSHDPGATAEGPAVVAGYEFRAGAPDATLSAIITAYEQNASVRPPLEVSEDFENGAGPFETYQSGTSTVAAAEGALRITGQDEQLFTESFSKLDALCDRILVTAVVELSAPLGPGQGPVLAVNREQDGAYGLVISGDQVVLLEWESFDDDPRLLDSAQLPAPVTGQATIALVFDGRGNETAVVGFVDGQALVGHDGVSGSFDWVSLGVSPAGSPLTVDFEEAEVYALAEGTDQVVFDTRQEYMVEHEGSDIATMSVLLPAECLRDLPDFGDAKCVPGLLAGAAPEGMQVGEEIIAGAPVTTGTQAGTSFWLWMQDGSLHVVTAPDAVAGRAFVEAFISQTKQRLTA